MDVIMRASADLGDGKNTKHKPVFLLIAKGFPHELRAVERLNTSIESLHRVVEDVVFKIFRARQMIFHQYIERVHAGSLFSLVSRRYEYILKGVTSVEESTDTEDDFCKKNCN